MNAQRHHRSVSVTNLIQQRPVKMRIIVGIQQQEVVDQHIAGFENSSTRRPLRGSDAVINAHTLPLRADVTDDLVRAISGQQNDAGAALAPELIEQVVEEGSLSDANEGLRPVVGEWAQAFTAPPAQDDGLSHAFDSARIARTVFSMPDSSVSRAVNPTSPANRVTSAH